MMAFAILQKLIANLTMQRQARYFGADALKMGPAVFCNDIFNSTTGGTTTSQNAVNAQSLHFGPHMGQNRDLECELSAWPHKHGAGVHNIERGALARRPGARAVHCPSHLGWQGLTQIPGGRKRRRSSRTKIHRCLWRRYLSSKAHFFLSLKQWAAQS